MDMTGRNNRWHMFLFKYTPVFVDEGRIRQSGRRSEATSVSHRVADTVGCNCFKKFVPE